MTFGLNWELASSELTLMETVFTGLYGCTVLYSMTSKDGRMLWAGKNVKKTVIFSENLLEVSEEKHEKWQ